jgi:hypothetical protein
VNVEIVYHGVDMPSAHHSDAVQVNLTTKHDHGAAGAEGAGDYLHDHGTRLDIVHHHGVPLDSCDIPCFDGCVSIVVVVCGNRCRLFYTMRPVVYDASNSCFDVATQGIAAGSLYRFLVSVAILLGGGSI